jgi:hypothetical protein
VCGDGVPGDTEHAAGLMDSAVLEMRPHIDGARERAAVHADSPNQSSAPAATGERTLDRRGLPAALDLLLGCDLLHQQRAAT